MPILTFFQAMAHKHGKFIEIGKTILLISFHLTIRIKIIYHFDIFALKILECFNCNHIYLIYLNLVYDCDSIFSTNINIVQIISRAELHVI